MSSALPVGIFTGWKKELGAAFLFLLKLLILQWIIQLFFYWYNNEIVQLAIFEKPADMANWVYYTLLSDLLVIISVNTFFFLLISIFSFTALRNVVFKWSNLLFILINLCCLLLNLADVFYFHFHLQRADADLLYVLSDPFNKLFIQHPGYTFLGICTMLLLFYIVFRFHRRIGELFLKGYHFLLTAIVMLFLLIVFVVAGKQLMVPTYPLAKLKSSQLPFVQNSVHTFLYSVYRSEEGMVRPYNFVPAKELNRSVVQQRISFSTPEPAKKNVVLFIMESLPEDFFNAQSRFKVKAPFFDSLLKQSTYFSNAFSYSHHSNKGIVSILSGIPTLTEIPLYHSNYAGLKMTPVGDKLAESGYTSAFFIGDNYDDFGFAKATKWMGIQQYYSKEDIPGYRQMESHTMGLHDEYVLSFMEKKIKAMKQPFFAVNFNVSTHFPNDLPKHYKEAFPEQNFTAGMKSMNYYGQCLLDFFKKAAAEPWYNNTVFIFCSDHWIYPDEKNMVSNCVQGFRIPIIVFDPSDKQQQRINAPVSQLDIMNTVFAAAGIKDTFISYGKNLYKDSIPGNRIVFSRESANLYHAFDSSYVVGLNIVTGKPEFCYNYRNDPSLKKNLLSSELPITQELIHALKVFLQTASWHYNKKEGFY